MLKISEKIKEQIEEAEHAEGNGKLFSTKYLLPEVLCSIIGYMTDIRMRVIINNVAGILPLPQQVLPGVLRRCKVVAGDDAHRLAVKLLRIGGGGLRPVYYEAGADAL